MTEYWVSQGNKWCDLCKIFISNNPASIRNHELGQRHKENVEKRLDNMRKQNIAKDKEQKEAAKALEQIEAKAKRSYQKDVKTFEEARDSNLHAFDGKDNEWEYDSSTGYYQNSINGFYYDPKSGFYYSDSIGKWVSRDEAFASPQGASTNSKLKKAISSTGPVTSGGNQVAEKASSDKRQSAPPPGRVVSASLNPMRNVKGAPSSYAVTKRKREEESWLKATPKAKVMTKEEAAALKAREAAKKRVEAREKPLLGLYRPPY